MSEKNGKLQLNFKTIPHKTQAQIAWLQQERGWANRTTLFVAAVDLLYRAENIAQRAEDAGHVNCRCSIFTAEHEAACIAAHLKTIDTEGNL